MLAGQSLKPPAGLSTELNYSDYSLDHSVYKFIAQTAISTGTTLTLSTSPVQNIINIPAGTMNLGASHLEFTTTITLPALFVNYFANGCPLIQDIQLASASGLDLVNITNVNKYLDIVTRRETKLTDALSMDAPDYLADTCSQWFEGLSMGPGNSTYELAGLAQAQSLTDSTATINTTPAGREPQRTFYTVGFSPIPTTLASFTSTTLTNSQIMEPTYLLTSAAATTVVLNWRISMSLFKNTFIGMDRTIYYPERLTLTLNWAPRTMCYFTTSALEDRGTVAGALTDIVISNLYFQVAYEQNQAIKDKLMREVQDGVTMEIPFVMRQTNSLSSTGQNNQVTVPRSAGRKLMKLYWAPYNGTESSRTAYDHGNLLGAVVSSIKITVDSQPTANRTYDETKQQSWLEVRNKLKGSCISTSRQYYQNYSLCLDFHDNYNPSNRPQFPPAQNFFDGLPLDQEHIINMECTTAVTTLKHYNFFVLTRYIKIDAEGIHNVN